MPTKGFYGYAIREPDAPCLVDGRGTRTRGEVLERIFRAANGLRALGLGKGDHVCLLVGNRSEFIELICASGISGTILTAANWHLKPEETSYVVSDCDATVLFCDADFAEVGLEAAARAPAVRTVISVGGRLDGAVELEEWLAAHDATDPPNQVTGGQMLYSSGTTGLPKGILRVPMNDDPDTNLEATERPTTDGSPPSPKGAGS